MSCSVKYNDELGHHEVVDEFGFVDPQFVELVSRVTAESNFFNSNPDLAEFKTHVKSTYNVYNEHSIAAFLFTWFPKKDTHATIKETLTYIYRALIDLPDNDTTRARNRALGGIFKELEKTLYQELVRLQVMNTAEAISTIKTLTQLTTYTPSVVGTPNQELAAISVIQQWLLNLERFMTEENLSNVINNLDESTAQELLSNLVDSVSLALETFAEHRTMVIITDPSKQTEFDRIAELATRLLYKLDNVNLLMFKEIIGEITQESISADINFLEENFLSIDGSDPELSRILLDVSSKQELAELNILNEKLGKYKELLAKVQSEFKSTGLDFSLFQDGLGMIRPFDTGGLEDILTESWLSSAFQSKSSVKKLRLREKLKEFSSLDVQYALLLSDNPQDQAKKLEHIESLKTIFGGLQVEQFLKNLEAANNKDLLEAELLRFKMYHDYNGTVPADVQMELEDQIESNSIRNLRSLAAINSTNYSVLIGLPMLYKKNEKYAAIESNPVFLEFYTFLYNLMGELHSSLPNYMGNRVTMFDLPSVPPDLMNALKSLSPGKMLNALKSFVATRTSGSDPIDSRLFPVINLAFDQITTNKKTGGNYNSKVDLLVDMYILAEMDGKGLDNKDDEFKKYKSNLSGEHIQSLKERAIKELQQEQAPFDILIATYMTAVARYKAAMTSYPIVSFVYRQMKGLKDINGNPRPRINARLESFIKDMFGINSKNNLILDPNRKVFTGGTALDKASKPSDSDSDNTKKEKESIREAYSRSQSQSGILDLITDFMQLIGLGWKTSSQFINYFIGQMGNYVEAAKNNYIDDESLHRAKFLIHTWDKKARNIMDNFITVSINVDITKRSQKPNWYEPYFLGYNVELLNQGSLAIAYLIKHKLYDKFDENGNFTGTIDEAAKLKTNLSLIISNVHGNYSSLLKIKVKDEWWGRMLMFMRNWVPYQFRERWGSDRKDIVTGKINRGRYRSYRQMKKGSVLKESIFNLGAQYVNLLSFGFLMNNSKAYDALVASGGIDAVDAGNLRANMRELAISTLTLGVLAMLSAIELPDEEEEKPKRRAYIYMFNMTARLYNDLGTFTSPSGMVDLVANPILFSSLFTRLNKLYGGILSIGEGELVYEEGPYKGQSPIIRNLMGILPVLSSFVSLDTESTIKFPVKSVTAKLFLNDKTKDKDE